MHVVIPLKVTKSQIIRRLIKKKLHRVRATGEVKRFFFIVSNAQRSGASSQESFFTKSYRTFKQRNFWGTNDFTYLVYRTKTVSF